MTRKDASETLRAAGYRLRDNGEWIAQDGRVAVLEYDVSAAVADSKVKSMPGGGGLIPPYPDSYSVISYFPAPSPDQITAAEKIRAQFTPSAVNWLRLIAHPDEVSA